MNRTIGILGGLGLGAGLMYLCDPEQGRRRRALLRDQLMHLMNRADATLCRTARDWSHRAVGCVAEARALLRPDTVSDKKLCERVRSVMGHAISQPAAIEVNAYHGHVTLNGHIPSAEVDGLLNCVSSVRGVKCVENLVQANGDGHPAHANADGMDAIFAPGTCVMTQ